MTRRENGRDKRPEHLREGVLEKKGVECSARRSGCSERSLTPLPSLLLYKCDLALSSSSDALSLVKQSLPQGPLKRAYLVCC